MLDDDGQVTLSQRQPEVGIAIHATVSDQDGGVVISRWKWERSVGTVATAVTACRDYEDDENHWTRINGISSAVYTPRQADFGKCLRATATYSDNIGDEQDAIGSIGGPGG